MYQEYAETRAKFLRTIWALRPQSILQEEGRQEHPEVLMGIPWRGYSRLSNDLEQHKSRFVRIDAARLGDHGDDVPRIHRRRQAQGFVAVGQTSMQKLSMPTQAPKHPRGIRKRKVRHTETTIDTRCDDR